MISAQDIAESEKKKQDIRKATYKAILEQLCRKIKNASELGERSTFLQIPPFVIGFPSYDIDQATEYLQRQLVRLGYKVIKVAKAMLGVSWGDVKSKGPVIIDHSMDEIPSFANLQKTAEKIRGKTSKK